jgi:hypothetical protein
MTHPITRRVMIRAVDRAFARVEGALASSLSEPERATVVAALSHYRDALAVGDDVDGYDAPMGVDEIDVLIGRLVMIGEGRG